jgi:hypothetical protein
MLTGGLSRADMGDFSARRVAARYLGEPVPTAPTAHKKAAANSPFPSKGDEQSPALSRNIPKGHEFNSKALKPLSKALWASSIALGHVLTAYRHVSRLKSTTVSPDGKLGGQGYVMDLGEMRKKLFEVSEGLSAISDTLYDELQAPHWKPKLSQLDEEDQEDVNRFIEEAEDIMGDPEAEAEEGIDEIERKSPSTKKKPEAGGEGSLASGLPQAGEGQEQGPGFALKTASQGSAHRLWGLFAELDRVKLFDLHTEFPIKDLTPKRSAKATNLLREFYADMIEEANSSLPVGVTPGGPRVDHLGPGTGDGEYGDFVNQNEQPTPPDEWSADGGGLSRRDDQGEDYDYPSAWENETSVSAESLYPDAYSDDTPTEAWDFGLGYGAKGQGAGGYANPSGEGNGSKGVEGPSSGLPGTPDESSGDSSTPIIDQRINPRFASMQELSEEIYGVSCLPEAKPVSRSDYYVGPKDNMVSMGQSGMPDGGGSAEDSKGLPSVDTHYVTEDLTTPYVRYDDTTRTLREPGRAHPGQNYQEPWALDGESTR